MHAQRRQPHPIERVRRTATASLALATFAAAAEVERRGIYGTERDVTRAIESRVKRPGAAGDGEVSRRVKLRRE